jgi:multidrug transporter EmrE-like cation transporter
MATFGQLYALALSPLGWMSSVFGAVSIILANLLGLLVLKQVLSPAGYAGVLLAVLAFLVMALFGSPSAASSPPSGP